MINSNMRIYDYYTFGKNNEYGQPQLSQDAQGSIKMAITVLSQFMQANIKYKDANYIGLTYDPDVNDRYVIKYGNTNLKVLYINPSGKMKQVFMGEM